MSVSARAEDEATSATTPKSVMSNGLHMRAAFGAYRRGVEVPLTLPDLTNDYGRTIEMPLKAARRRLRYAEIPVPNQAGRVLEDIGNVARFRIRLREDSLAARPLRPFSIVGRAATPARRLVCWARVLRRRGATLGHADVPVPLLARIIPPGTPPPWTVERAMLHPVRRADAVRRRAPRWMGSAPRDHARRRRERSL